MPQSEFPKGFGPYLRFAIATGFRTFEPLEGKRLVLFLLVEFIKVGRAREFEKAMARAGFRVEFGPVEDHSRFATLRSSQQAVTDGGTFPIWDKYLAGVELSLPIETPTEALEPRVLNSRWQEGKDPPGSLLMGMLDDGCPFAAAHFLRPSISTRVRGIWDQNRNMTPIPVKDRLGNLRHFGQQPTDFGYGLEFRRDYFVPSDLMGLDEWIELHSTAGNLDEDGCYADAKFKNLLRRRSHGGHVMDVLAGRVPTSARLGPSRPGDDRRDPPSWQKGNDPASGADIVFVQFPDECIRDATGVWLKAYVFEGIQYILSFADPAKTKNVVINISYGPTTGPHDGTAELEKALRKFVREFNGTPGKPKLEIVLPAGNAYLSGGHIAFTRQAGQPDSIEWTWRLPPDNAVLCFAEVWMDNSNAAAIRVTLTSPSGVSTTSPPGLAPPPPGVFPPSYTGVYAPVARGSHTMWLLTVEPTKIAADGPNNSVAEHGDWRVKVTNIVVGANVHAYVARSDPNLGVRTGARLSYFIDQNWEMKRFAEASCKYDEGEFDRTGSLVERYGTLNGIATANEFPCARGRWLHSCEWTQVALFVGRPSTQRPARPSQGSRLCAGLRRVLCSPGHTCRRQQERQRVSPHGHQRCGTATGEAPSQSADPTADP